MLVDQSRKIQKAYDTKLLLNRGGKITPRQSDVLQTISEFPDIGNKELMLILGITLSTLKDHLLPLQIRDLIRYKSGYRGLKTYRVNKTAMRKIMLIN